MYKHLKRFRLRPSSIIPTGVLVAPTFGISSDLLYLPILLIIIPTGLLWLLFGHFKVQRFHKIFFYSPILLFLLWVYGVTLGYLNGNEPEFIVRNFAGITVYLTVFYFMFVKLDFPEFFRIMAIAAAVALIAAAVNTNYSGLGSLSYVDSIGQIKSWRSNTILYIFPFLFLAILGLTDRLSGIGNTIVTVFIGLICAFYIVAPTMSKGNLLCIFVLLAISFFRLLTGQNKILALALFIAPLLVVLLVNMLGFDFHLLIEAFSPDNLSNQIRQQQFDQIIDDSTFFGNGLGAVLTNGYLRLDKYSYGSYGLELTYLSVLHKVGMFSLVYFFVIFATLSTIFKKFGTKESYFLLGAMIYLIPGAGNPILFSPPLVVVHSMIIAMFALNSAFPAQERLSSTSRR